MIINNAVNAGPFVYCGIAYSPNTKTVYHNAGEGHYQSHIYVLAGSAVAYDRTIEDTSFLPVATRSGDLPGTLIDVSEGRDRWIETVAGDQGLMIVMFHPIPSSRELDIEILKEGLHRISATDKRKTIVVMDGKVDTNSGKKLESLQFAKLLPGNSVEINIHTGGVVAVVQDK